MHGASAHSLAKDVCNCTRSICRRGSQHHAGIIQTSLGQAQTKSSVPRSWDRARINTQCVRTLLASESVMFASIYRTSQCTSRRAHAPRRRDVKRAVCLWTTVLDPQQPPENPLEQPHTPTYIQNLCARTTLSSSGIQRATHLPWFPTVLGEAHVCIHVHCLHLYALNTSCAHLQLFVCG